MEILVADDDRMSRRLLETYLKDWGHEVRLTEDGEAACKALEEADGPMLAILDWMMPKMSGVEICPSGPRKQARNSSLYGSPDSSK